MGSIAENAQAAVRIDNDLGVWFKMTMGTRQGDPISATPFIMYLEIKLNEIMYFIHIIPVLHVCNAGVRIQSRPICVVQWPTTKCLHKRPKTLLRHCQDLMLNYTK